MMRERERDEEVDELKRCLKFSFVKQEIKKLGI